jgi:hypothetical protein
MNNKPIVLTYQEFADKICDVVNNTPLPAFVMRSVLRDLDKALQTKEQQEYQFALSMQGKEEPKNE